MSQPTQAQGGRRLDAALNFLDRQIVDSDGRMAGKVDDLELEKRDDGSLVVTALLSGPGALGPRLPGFLGRAVIAAWRRLSSDGAPSPARIDYSAVKTIASAVELSLPRSELPNQELERWARSRIISKLPGAGHAAE
jgi:sporulation protein YlmC with PRC-barrel domain